MFSMKNWKRPEHGWKSWDSLWRQKMLTVARSCWPVISQDRASKPVPNVQKGTRVVLQVNRPANQGNVITEPSTYVSLAPTETQESTGTTLPSQTTQSSSQAQGSKTWYRYRMRNEDDPTTIKQEGRERVPVGRDTDHLWIMERLV